MVSASQVYVFRLQPHDDLRLSILQFALKHDIGAGIILTCVGSLEQLNIRFANQAEGTRRTGYFEIMSCAGTFSTSSCHLHLAVADGSGVLSGGHLLNENLIYTTAEIAVAALGDLRFERVPDPTYGFAELVVTKRDLRL